MFKLFRAGPGQGDGLASAERLQNSSYFIIKLFRAGPGQGLTSTECLQLPQSLFVEPFRAGPGQGLTSTECLQLPQSLFVEPFRAGPGKGDGLATAERLQSSSKFCINFSDQALAKVMDW
jgi:hypothetical protein